MGKKTRRNNKRPKGQNKTKAAPYQNDPSLKSNSQDPAVLQRIRHADPRTRHAALAAVANSLLDVSSLKLPPQVTAPLLQAIRERLLDADLDVCQVAAGCLANCVTILAAETDSTTKGSMAPPTILKRLEELETLSAGWIIVLVGRLQQCYAQFVLLLNENTGSKTTQQQKKQQKQWLALAVQCWRALCVLVETNPKAVGRLTSIVDPTPRQDFHQVLLEWLQHSQACWSSSTAAASASATDSANKKVHSENSDGEACRPLHRQIMTLATRTLHSAWDDNIELLKPWKEECPDAFSRALGLLQASIQDQSLPVEVPLHATGAILAARSILPTQQAIIVVRETVLPQLESRLHFSWDTAQTLLSAYHAAATKYGEEEADEAVERDIIRKVADRKESSRDIARRQKERKEAQRQAADKNELMEEDTKPSPVVEQDDSAQMEQDQKEEVETREALERARQAWNDFLLPLQLSLELLANITSQGGSDFPQDEDDVDEMRMDQDDWGPEQEAQWMQEQKQQQERLEKQRSKDEVFQKAIVESALPTKLEDLFRHVYKVPIVTAILFPEQSQQDLEDLQSKVVACLGNCWENISFWPLQLSWAELQQAATTATGAGKEGLASAMVIALKTRPSLRKEWQPEHLAFWLRQVGNSTPENSAKEKLPVCRSDLSIRRDAISMLAILCSQEPHPPEVNRQVSSTLLSALTNPSESLLIQTEVLSAFMDMYGNDEDDGICHQTVFESMQILSHFQRCIPTIKSKIKAEERKLNQGSQSEDGADRLELEQWKETVLNGSRFVQYKKGQL